MNYQLLGKTKLKVPAIGVGCMRMANMLPQDLQNFIAQSLDLGMNFFDHADIYGGGKCEEVFADGIKSLNVSRDKIIL